MILLLMYCGFSNNLENNKMAFDLCAFYMSQIGEAAKLLTDETKESFEFFNVRIVQNIFEIWWIMYMRK